MKKYHYSFIKYLFDASNIAFQQNRLLFGFQLLKETLGIATD
ncbi:hypothetical protein [Flavobacterium phragmitis]|nr:hypothetical protein [Flavobacterium phragmitis]